MSKPSPILRTVLFFLLCLALAGCQDPPRSGFDEGHAWIMPRPAAEIRLSVVDAEGTPVPGPTLWAFLGDDSYTDGGGFVGYDPQSGFTGDASGEFILQYLGETGGGYEVPINAPSPPQHRLVIEAPGYTPISLHLDDLLFVQKNRTGTTSVVIGNATIEMVVVTYSLILEKE